MHLLQGVVDKGANLQTNTPVTHLAEAPLPDGRWVATTPRGPIKARKVLLATNAYTAGLAPQFARPLPVVASILGPDSVTVGAIADALDSLSD